MTIYGEYLFIENFLAGYGLLRLTGMLCGRRASGVRVAAGAVMCGLFAFVALLGISRLVALGLGTVFASGLMAFVFRPGSKAAAVRLTGVFFVVSFMLGGAVIAFIYAVGVKGFISNGVLYIGSHGYLIVLAGAAAGLVTAGAAADHIRRASCAGKDIFDVRVEITGKILRCLGKVDTGNSLREPLSGKPVSLVRKDLAEQIWGELISEDRIRLVPFRSVGCNSGILAAVRCDCMIISGSGLFGNGKIFLKDVYLGLYDGAFDNGGSQDHDILLQPEIAAEMKSV